MGNDRLRIDRWLFYCRFYKTRKLATEAVAAGHVRINGERAVPGKSVKPGDQLDLTRERLPYRLVIEAIPKRRGPAPEVRACYSEDDEVVLRRQELAATLRRDRLAMPRTEGRPDKRTRRLLISRNRD